MKTVLQLICAPKSFTCSSPSCKLAPSTVMSSVSSARGLLSPLTVIFCRVGENLFKEVNLNAYSLIVTRVQTNLWEFCSNSCFDFAHSSFGVDVNCQRKTICKCWRLRGRRYCQGHHSWTRMSGRKHVSVSKNQKMRLTYSNMRGVGQERNEQPQARFIRVVSRLNELGLFKASIRGTCKISFTQ